MQFAINNFNEIDDKIYEAMKLYETDFKFLESGGYSMSLNVNGSTSQVNTGNNWFQNMKTANSKEQKTMNALSPKGDNAVKISISQEGIESYRKKLQECGVQSADGNIMEKKHTLIEQSKNAIFDNQYENELAQKASELKGQRENNGTYSLSNKVEDYVKAYGSLYDEIVQGYKDGARERYVADENSETGFRKMTMEEELNNLDKAFQKTADTAGELAENTKNAAAAFKDTAEKLAKIKGAKSSFADAYKNLETEGYTSQENIGQKMVTLAQAWKDAYQVSASKDSGMEKVLSMLNDMFRISNEAQNEQK